ncbi:hypothetical protein BKA81DRAFT_28047 [Phyllosticta paracitricarpa]
MCRPCHIGLFVICLPPIIAHPPCAIRHPSGSCRPHLLMFLTNEGLVIAPYCTYPRYRPSVGSMHPCGVAQRTSIFCQSLGFRIVR